MSIILFDYMYIIAKLGMEVLLLCNIFGYIKTNNIRDNDGLWYSYHVPEFSYAPITFSQHILE